MLRSALLLFLVVPLQLVAQLTIPPSSAPTTLQSQIGLTNFTITYHRPGLKGRVIFGDLIPFDQVWRTGANEATRIQFDQDISIQGEQVKAGTYAIYTVPRAEGNDWTFVLNADTSLWGARGYDESKDVLRVDIAVKQLPERIETMEFRWMNITHSTASLALEWENTRLSVPVALFTNQQVAASIANNLTSEKNAKGIDYYRAARYYLDNGLDLEQAKTWMDKRMELDGEQFGIMRYQAIIERKLGNTEEAERLMQRSLALAEKAPNPHYVRMNTKTLREWNKEQLAYLTGAAVLAKSIAYHDPNGQWMTAGVSFNLYESRPGGSYRRSAVSLNEGNGLFTLNQIRGKNVIYREYGPEGCTNLLNGRADGLTEAEVSEHRLSCERGAVYRDYYTYLWGLPMKLRDEGTIIAPEVYQVDFFGQELLEVKVTYSEAVGDDIWYFYFDPETYALSGYRFYHDEAVNDGEYILLEGEAQLGTIKLPAKRHWYTHAGGLYLGTDEIIE